MSLHHRRRRALATAVAAAIAASSAAVVLAVPAAANPPMPDDPIGKLEAVTVIRAQVTVQGWAADPDSTRNVKVYALVDGAKRGAVLTSVRRPNITRRHHTGPTPGFILATRVSPGGVHTVCVAVRDIGRGITRVLGCRVTPLGTALSGAELAAHNPTGALGGVWATATTFSISGWAAEPDFRVGRIVVVLYVDGQPVVTADTHRATAAQRAAGAGKRGAFTITVPVAKGAHNGCVWAVNTGLGTNTPLGCRAADTRGRPASGPVTVSAMNLAVVREARKHIGQPYVFAAEGPRAFDCSGLVWYAYHKAGFTPPRVAQDQFTAAHLIPASRAVRGDLVFYHDSLGYVYHVGIYTKPLDTIAAIDEAEGVAHQHIWDPSTATYGSFTHR